VVRDLKPENIFLTSSGAKLADFGCAADLNDPDVDLEMMIGTREYMAPELLLGHKYDERIDVWGLGILTFELLTGRTPFYSEDEEEMENKIRSLDYECPIDMDFLAKEFITRLLVDREQRMTISEVQKHSFIRRFT
jgi:serine/threonine protein kinase